MATTSLWRVRGYIGKVLLYAEDPEKTTLPKSIGFDDADKDTLEDVIAYASREEATNQRQLISGINRCAAGHGAFERIAGSRFSALKNAADRKRWYAKCCMTLLARNAPVSCC